MIPGALGAILALGLASAGTGAPAEPLHSLEGRMGAKLAESFAALPGPDTQGECLVLAPLGMPLTGEELRQPEGLLRLADQIPRPGPVYMASGRTVSGTFGAILRFAQVTRYQDQATMNRLHDIQRMLKDRRRPGHPSQAYAAYLRCRSEHRRALDARAAAQAEFQACGRPLPADLEARVEETLQAWVRTGFKEPIENALAYLERACDANVRTVFNGLAQGYALAAAEAGDHAFPLEADPPFPAWLEDSGWQPWSFRQKDAPLRDRRPLRQPSGEPGPALEPAQARWQETLEMTARLKRINVHRAWLDLAFFRSRAWRLPSEAGFTRVSSGGAPEETFVNPGVMPQVVTGLLLARDLSIQGAWEGAPGTGVPTRAGPFALASPPGDSRLPLHPYAAIRSGSLAIRVQGFQIIGFFCTPLPASPDPDPKYFR